jgi:hypothetical protein
MAILHAFSKILIFKNTPKTQYYFGGSERVPGTGTIDNSTPTNSGESKTRSVIFNSVYPTANLENFLTSEPSFIQDNLLHSLGTSTDVTGNIYAEAQLAGTAYITSDQFVYYNRTATTYTEDNYAAILALTSPTNGDTATALDTGYVYTYASLGDVWSVSTYYTTIISSTISPILAAGDYIFYGPANASDPNNLKVAGKIKTVFSSGSDEYIDDKKLYELEKPAGNSEATELDVYSDLYFYRSSWNGKNISVDLSDGFYVLISVDENNGFRALYPFLGPGNTSEDGVLDISTGTSYTTWNSFTDLIKIKRISKKYKSDENDSAGEDIACSVFRTNTFNFYNSANLPQYDGSGNPQLFLNGPGDVPYWCAYFVNPYGKNNTKLDKNTVYSIEINEMLPTLIAAGSTFPDPGLGAAATTGSM